MKPDEQAREVVKVNAASGIITGAVTLTPDHTIAEAKTRWRTEHFRHPHCRARTEHPPEIARKNGRVVGI
jgi:hypothetical protein